MKDEFFGPGQAGAMAVYVRKRTIEAIESRNKPEYVRIEEVKYRYLQSKIQLSQSILQTQTLVLFGATSMAIGFLPSLYPKINEHKVASAALGAAVVPTMGYYAYRALHSINNTEICNGTKKAAEQFLCEKLGEDGFKDFKQKADYRQLQQEYRASERGRAKL